MIHTHILYYSIIPLEFRVCVFSGRAGVVVTAGKVLRKVL